MSSLKSLGGSNVLLEVDQGLIDGADDSEGIAYDIRGSSLWRVASSFDSKGTLFMARDLG